MDERPNYYRILHVQSDAPLEIIKTSYRTLMQRMKMHPDLGGDHDVAMLINEAYATLSNPELRAAYDRELEEIERHREAASEFAEAAEAAQSEQAETAAEEPAAAPETASEQTTEPGCCPFCNTRHEPSMVTDYHYCSACGSPLRPVLIERSHSNARRAVERMPKHLPLRFFLKSDPDTRHDGHMINISPGGLRFSTERALPVGTILRIECATCLAVARVTNSTRQEPFEIGVQFLTLEFRANTGSIVSIVA